MDINGLCKHHREAEMKPSHSIHTYIHTYICALFYPTGAFNTDSIHNMQSAFAVSVFLRQDIHVARVIKSQVGGQVYVCMCM